MSKGEEKYHDQSIQRIILAIKYLLPTLFKIVGPGPDILCAPKKHLFSESICLKDFFCSCSTCPQSISPTSQPLCRPDLMQDRYKSQYIAVQYIFVVWVTQTGW